MEAQKYVWEGAIPLQIHLHESEVTTFPPPPPALVSATFSTFSLSLQTLISIFPFWVINLMSCDIQFLIKYQILAPRIGYLPLLIGLIKPYFSSALPPGVDTVWLEYKGLPLKWYIPTGVLFDLLCAEPERPWNLTIHFRGYPANILIPCEGEDAVKWSFINSLKEAAYIINGNCKNIMNMSQSDQVELWRSVMNGNVEAYQRVSSKLKLGTIEDEYAAKMNFSLVKSQQGTGETDLTGQVKTGRIPIRLYVCSVSEDFDDLEDVPKIDSWDKISFLNRPVEVHKEEGKYLSLHEAIKALLPKFFSEKPLIESPSRGEDKRTNIPSEEDASGRKEEEEENVCEEVESSCTSNNTEIKLVRIQGIEPKLEIPFSWVVNNLMNPDHFLHICVYIKVPTT